MYKCEKCKLDFVNNGGYTSHISKCHLTPQDVEQIKKDYIDVELSIRDIKKKYKISTSIVYQIIGKDNIRSLSDALVITNRNKPRITSDKTKQKQREARLTWMKDNPEKTAWRLKNISYPEKVFLNKMLELQMDKKHLIIRERSVFPYFIDFAFENEKIAVEIDGAQHELEDRKNKDIEKDRVLNENGWVVLRFSASKINMEVDECVSIISEYLKDIRCENVEVGVFKFKEVNNKKIFTDRFKKCGCGNMIEKKSNSCKVCSDVGQRKVERPSYEQLLRDVEELGYLGSGRKYGVSDNCVRKWIKIYKQEKMKNIINIAIGIAGGAGSIVDD
jgi:very-short-patch-repair endonuclease